MDRDRGVRSWLKRTDVPLSQPGGVPAGSDAPTLWPQDTSRGLHDEPGKPIPRTGDAETNPSDGKSGTL